jgi:hypothetical protein
MNTSLLTRPKGLQQGEGTFKEEPYIAAHYNVYTGSSITTIIIAI